jgi:hypothetical protein
MLLLYFFTGIRPQRQARRPDLGRPTLPHSAGFDAGLSRHREPHRRGERRRAESALGDDRPRRLGRLNRRARRHHRLGLVIARRFGARAMRSKSASQQRRWGSWSQAWSAARSLDSSSAVIVDADLRRPTRLVGVPDDPADRFADDINHITLLRTLLILNIVILIGFALEELVNETGIKLPLFVNACLSGSSSPTQFRGSFPAYNGRSERADWR